MARVWNTATGDATTELPGHNDIVTAVAFSPDGRRLLTSGGDGTARVWDASVGAAQRLLPGGFGISDAVFSPDRTRVAADGLPGVVWVAASAAGTGVQGASTTRSAGAPHSRVRSTPR